MLAVAVTAALALIVVFTLRAFQTTRTDEHLCQVVREIVSQGAEALGDPGEPPTRGMPGFSYYMQHPMELETARRQAQENLAKLDCNNLPSAGGSL